MYKIVEFQQTCQKKKKNSLNQGREEENILPPNPESLHVVNITTTPGLNPLFCRLVQMWDCQGYKLGIEQSDTLLSSHGPRRGVSYLPGKSENLDTSIPA